MILCYHDVDSRWRSRLAMDPAMFADHCAWLAEHREVVGLTEAIGSVDAEWIPTRQRVAMTFDDGLRGVHDFALPALDSKGLPATLYLVAATLTPDGHPVDWVDDVPPGVLSTMTRSQVAEWISTGRTIGSHSWQHLDLTTLSYSDCVDDLRRSREHLENEFQVEVRTLAYPRGRHNAEVRRAAEEAGFEFGLALPTSPEDPGSFAIPRVGLWADNGVKALAVKSSRRFWSIRMGRAYPVGRAAVRLIYRAKRLGSGFRRQ